MRFFPRRDHNSAFSSSHWSALRHWVTSSHSQKQPVSPLRRQRSCGQALWAQRVLLPPTVDAAASLSGPGLNTGRHCCCLPACFGIKASCQEWTIEDGSACFAVAELIQWYLYLLCVPRTCTQWWPVVCQRPRSCSDYGSTTSSTRAAVA